MKIKVYLHNSGFLLPGAGEGSALIDCDPVTSRQGFPYIPARTFKGLLKESVQEVLEIEGRESESEALCKELFGTGQKTPALLRFRSLTLPNWQEIREQFPAFQQQHKDAFVPERIKAYYTAEISQTAVATDGIAKERSLRTIRAIKPGHTFEGYINYDAAKISDSHEALLKRAALQLRFAGTKRNRGFGKIKVSFVFPEPGTHPETETGEKPAPPDSPDPEVLEIRITTHSPTVLSSLTSDSNTVSTDRFVRGSRVRGLLAEQLLKSGIAKEHAHENTLFHQAILSGEICIRPAYPVGNLPVPLNVHREKAPKKLPAQVAPIQKDSGLLLNVPDDDKQKLIPLWDIFSKDIQSRSIGGLGSFQEKQLTVHQATTSAHFHNSRLNRSAGRNMKYETEGGIFYYEGLEAGATFSGQITGSPEILGKLMRKLPTIWRTTIGKSKSTQYGDIEIKISPGKRKPFPTNVEKNTTVFLHFRSAIALLNAVGMPQANIAGIEAYLAEFKLKAKVAQIATVVFEAETWSRQWNCRTGKFPAFKEGSILQLEPEEKDDPNWLPGLKRLHQKGLGELREQGFGWVEIEAVDQFPSDTQGGEKAKEEPAKLGNNETLKAILGNYQREKTKDEVRLHASKEATSRAMRNQLIPNHLLGRLEQKLTALAQKHGTTPDLKKEFQKWICTLKEKPAGETLKRMKLYTLLEEFDKILPKSLTQTAGIEVGEKWACIWWEAFFKTIRNFNKKQKA
ncbi:MAG TPA: hypothetical protein ENJ82_17125 [Bacteroidetes bacterium]|nr:hypothetical protein [Bacteroidota bacterium]